jgi:hypothetical protein
MGSVTDGQGRLAGLDRRGWVYLGGAIAVTLVAGMIVSILAYAVLAGAAIGAWVTRQDAAVRWILTPLALVLVAALVLGFGVSVDHGSTVGPITRQR